MVQMVAKRADVGGRPSRASAVSTSAVCIALAASVASFLALVPIDGLLPGSDLDGSWAYVLADAAAHHRAFGREVVFTFGPLSSLYSHLFLPSQRTAVLAANLVLVAAFCLGATALARPRLRPLVLALPLVFGNFVLVDAFFLTLPWLIVPLAGDVRAAKPWRAAALPVLAAVLGPLLLVKGTLALPLAGSLAAASLAAWPRSRAIALSLPAAAAAAVAAAWTATGQPLPDLPHYLREEFEVAAGYTDAMSELGDPREIIAFLAAAAALIAAQLVPRRQPALPTLAAALLLFVAFKAGFVRHDGHATIAASTLLLLGFLLLLRRADAAAGVGFAAGLACWCFVGGHYFPTDPAADWARAAGAVGRGSIAIRAAIADPDAFRRSFEERRRQVAAEVDLPPTSGTADLYSASQGALLASGRDYAPRPVIQSYSAYTPRLAGLNADHLRGPAAPRTVFFAPEPIDERFPALEDGPSWPALLGEYRFRALTKRYAVLDRVEGAGPAPIGAPLVRGSFAFDKPIPVPTAVPFVWATLAFHPTPLGKLASALFKLPPLVVAVTTADGTTTDYRLIAGMAEAGFLLSPVVRSAADFVALRSTAVDALAPDRVASIAVRQLSSSKLWGSGFELTMAPLLVPPDPGADDQALGHLDPGPPADDLPVSGACAVDAVGEKGTGGAPVVVPGPTVAATGWGLLSTATGDDGGRLRIALTPAGGPTSYAPAERTERPDVDAFFGLHRPTRAGFSARLNLSGMEGPIALRVVQDGPDGPAACGPPIEILREAAAGG